MTQAPDSITNNAELEDGVEETPFTLAQIDTALLTSPAVLRSIGGIAIGLAMLAWPDRSDRVLARLIGLAFIWLAAVALRKWASGRPRDWFAGVAAAATLAMGAVLFIAPDQSTIFLGRLLGAALVGLAALSAYRLWRTTQPDWARLALYGLAAAIGLLLIVMPEAAIGTVTALGAIWAVTVSALMLVVSLDARTDGVATYSDTTELVSTWLRDRPKSVDARQSLYDKILYEGPTTQTRVIRFFALMGFAAVIASMGVITDSTAVVIGAMLVAPLMTPLMGMAISLVMGWPNRLTRSAALAAGGIVFAISIGALLGLISPTIIDTTTNSQILARTSPTILDLITAVAAGAAGAYGLSRPDVSDSLPGVAIAISLVPPLAVVGISYSQGDWTAGHGALLLFATNMIAILLVGGLTFILTGVTPLQRVAESQHRVRTAVIVTCTFAVFIFGALLLNGAEVTENTVRQSTIESTVDDWLPEDAMHRLVSVDIKGSTVTAVVVGPSTGLPEVTALADTLSDELDKTITVNVSLVVEERLTATSG